MPRVVGIDPGLNGALAVLGTGDNLPHLVAMPIGVYRISRRNSKRIIPIAVAEWLKDEAPLDWGFIERQQAFPGQGASSGFKTGEGQGILRGVLAGCRIPTHIIEASKWKKLVGLQRHSTKDQSRALAMELWPALTNDFRLKKDDGKAEACLIAKAGLIGFEQELWS